MKKNAPAVMSHIGICTADVDRSCLFYTEALGFVRGHSIEKIGPPFDHLTELPGVMFCAQYLQCGGVTIELIGYPESAVTGSTARRPMNQLGFTHMTLKVDDVDAAAARIVEYGGQVHAETRIDSRFGPMVFCTDPNGVRIELMQANT